MKLKTIGPGTLAIAIALCLAVGSSAHAADYRYQGYLEDSGKPANGHFDVRLTAYADSKTFGHAAAPILLDGVEIIDGRVNVPLPAHALPDDLNQIWLQAEVRATGDDQWFPLPDRQKISLAAGTCPPSWELAGNSGIDPNLDFLGTTDGQPMILRTRNARSLRIEPSPNNWNALPLTVNFIAGSHGNNVSAGVRGATISGGGVAPGGNDPDISGANPNKVTDHYGVVGGGFDNRAGNDNASLTDAAHSTVGGGLGNWASGVYATVSGGERNQATSIRASVSGGVLNVASGWQSMIPGGSMNCAGGANSFAAGINAKVRPASNPGTGSCSGLGSYPGGTGDDGSFVWGGSGGAISSGPNQFIVHTSRAYFGTGTGSISIPAGRLIHTSTGAFLSSGGTWTNSSSRARKENFMAVDPQLALNGLMELPISRWTYKDSGEEGTHLGPMAEDFHDQFGLGIDGNSISTVDADGIAFAAIQGLNQKLESENAALVARLTAMDVLYREELDALRAEQAANLLDLSNELAQLRELALPAVAAGGH